MGGLIIIASHPYSNIVVCSTAKHLRHPHDRNDRLAGLDRIFRRLHKGLQKRQGRFSWQV